MSKQDSLGFIEELYSTIRRRAKSKKKNSYTNLLLNKGKNKIAQKIGEESTELIIDYLNGSKKISIKDIKKELTKRKNVRR